MSLRVGLEVDSIAFGLGERYEEEHFPEPVRRQIEIACECWFTSQGKTMPLMIKFQDEDGRIQKIRDIQVNHTEWKRYAGISAIEYDCNAEIQGVDRRVRLIFYTERCRWAMCVS